MTFVCATQTQDKAPEGDEETFQDFSKLGKEELDSIESELEKMTLPKLRGLARFNSIDLQFEKGQKRSSKDHTVTAFKAGNR